MTFKIKGAEKGQEISHLNSEVTDLDSDSSATSRH
jgi:hypothetical protein